MSDYLDSKKLNELQLSEIEVPFLDKAEFGKILAELNETDSSDVYIKSGYPIAFKKNNKKCYVSRPIREDELTTLINEIKVDGSYTDVKTGKQLDFPYSVRKGNEILRFRLACRSFNGNTGVGIIARTIKTNPPSHLELSLPKEIVQAHLNSRKGISFFTGDTGSGKSTSQAALNRLVLEETDSHLITYEDPIEYTYEGLFDARTDCTQYEVGKDVNSYEVALKTCLRENPDFIVLGESRDAESISAALTLAETGHSVSSTLHVSRGFTLFSRVVNMFEPKQHSYIKTRLADMLNYIVFQKLVIGKKGKRFAIREYLVLDKKDREMLLRCKTEDLSICMYDLFKTKGRLINHDIREAFDSGLITKEVFQGLNEMFEVDTEMMKEAV